jgi:hypothetical protein
VGIWDEIKDFVSGLKLVEIKNQLTEKGNVTVIIGGRHYYGYPPSETNPQKLAKAEVTPELEEEFQKNLKGSIEAKSDVIGSLSLEESSRTVAELVVQSAVHALSSEVVDTVKIKEEVIVEVQDAEDENEDSS